MTIVKRAIRTLIGPERASRIAYTYGHGAIPYRLTSSGRRSSRRLTELRGRYAGERCFIIGNGPSVAGMDLAPLRRERTFGLNRGYLLFDRIGGPTTFLVAVNDYVIEQFGSDIVDTPAVAFLSWHSRHLVPARGDPVFIKGSYGPRFCENVSTEGAWEGATVTYVAMQLAFHMGFSEVILIGVDHSFSTKGSPHLLVTSTAEDVDHFNPEYFGPGVRWQLPDLDTSEIAYRLAKDHFERHGRRIVDATVDGQLTVFPKVDYARAIERESQRA
jgi:hypothetical protein